MKEKQNYLDIIKFTVGATLNPVDGQITLSLYFSCGTGTPHFKSLVIHRCLNPSLSHAFVAWIAFWLQDPATDILLIYSSNFS